MAGRKKLAAWEAQLVEEAAVLGCTPDEVIFDRIRSGEKIADISESYGFSRHYFYIWLKAGGDGRKNAYEEAKRELAEKLVDDAQEILDDPTPVISPAEVALRKARANFRTWLAGKRDKEQFGEQSNADVNVNLNLGNLHLDALRAASVAPSPSLPPAADPEEPPTLEAEWEPADADDDPLGDLR
jgi:hypothetical protein